MEPRDDPAQPAAGDHETPFRRGMILDERYEIQDERFAGGMAIVFRAVAIREKCSRAIKASLPGADAGRSSLAFEREGRALSDLSHPNIVSLLDSGNAAGISFLVLEWLPGGDLTQRIQARGASSWSDFYEAVGRPLLAALAYAHQRHWAHRDLKPQNVLFDEAGTPKITDFGIARNTNQPQLGLTFHQSGSPPYTPPETDDGYRSDVRDLYSWAAIATSCLVGTVFHSGDELRLGFESLRDLATPKSILRRALSPLAADRHEAAVVLLADLDAYHMAAIRKSQAPLDVFIRISPSSLKAIKEQFPALDEKQCMLYVVDDLNSCWSAVADEGTGTVNIIGATIRLRCAIDEFELIADQLVVQTPDRAQKMREQHNSLPGVTFCAETVRDYKAAREGVRTFFSRLDIADSVRAKESEDRRRAYWFDCWADFLREKERLYKVKQKGFIARRIDEEDDFFLATLEGDFEREELGTSLVLQTATGKPVIFNVMDVQADQVRLSLRSGRKGDISRTSAFLQTNFEAERKSLQKQRLALEDIRAGRTVSPTIGAVLSEPEIAAPPEPAGLQFPGHLSEDKRHVLDKAMEVSSLLVVNGPPGTGKTTLIAELISAYLNRYPERRILLSSQTHVALDHIIAKLDEKKLADDVVRIAPVDSESASKVNKSVERLTLERKVKDWCLKAEARAERFMESFAQAKGINAYEVKAELMGRSYMEARKLLQQLNARRKVVDERKATINEKRLEEIGDGRVPDPHMILRQTEDTLTEEDDLRQHIDSIEARLNRIVGSLNRLDGLGVVFSEATDDALEDLLDGLVVSDVRRRELLPVMQLHLDWLSRLGSERSFHGAALREARVVAGTCIGLASTPAFQQDEYDLCIIDEASKATATEALVPMSRSRRTILVGDPKQLPPYVDSAKNDNGESVFSDDSKKSLLSVLLSRLPSENIEELVEQRRMCNTIGSLVSEVFYDSKLVNVRTDDERNLIVQRLFPMAVTWLSTTRLRKHGETEVPGNTYINSTEAHEVIEQLKEISRQTRKTKKPVEVAVIAAYSAQVALLRDRISQQVGFHSGFVVEVNTVDAFQGREADICIYSVTRSNDGDRIGFQREKERLNVALSRARDALVIVGDAVFCHQAKDPNPFRAVIDYIRENADFCLLKDL